MKMFACGALTLSAFAFIPSVLSQGNLTGLLQALNSSCLDQFANATVSLNGTTTGNQILAQLSEGNKTIFAPSDGAWSSVNPAYVNNQSRLADIISYHIVSGNFVNQTQTHPNETIGRTLLNDPNLVRLEGNKSQVLVWSKSDNGSLFVMNNGTNIAVTNTTTYNNSAILTIDSVLVPPPNISVVLHTPSYNTSLVAGLLQSFPNGTSILDKLNSARGITLFAPNDAGVQAAQSCLSSLSKNATALQNVLFNHVINGTSVYSTEFSNSSTLVSAAGEDYAFSSNSTGVFVSVGGSNQVQIVEPNVLTSNGVVHIVNGVMVDTNSDPSAASSAFISATSVAHSVLSTASVAATATSASASASSASASTPTPTSGVAKSGADTWKMGTLVGMIVGFGQLV